MPFRTVIVASVLLVFVAASPPYPMRSSAPPQSLTSIIKMEEPCVRQGGTCKPISECDPNQLVLFRGVLCPMQKHLDVECCYQN